MVSPAALLFSSLSTLVFSQTPGWQLDLYPVPEELQRTIGEPEFAPGSLLRINSTSSHVCLDSERTQVRIRPTTSADWRDVAVIAEPPSFYSCPPSITVALPRPLPVGRALLEVRVDGNELLTPLSIVPSRFGILSWEKAPLTRPLSPGSVVRITGTGLGLATSSDIHAELDGQSIEFVEARHDNGRDELSFRLPSVIVAKGCYTPVAMRIAGRWTKAIPIAVSPTGGPCVHPLQLTDSQMGAIDAGRSVALGTLRLVSHLDQFSHFESEFVFAGENTLTEAAFAVQEEGCRLAGPNPGLIWPRPALLDEGPMLLRLPAGGSVPAPYRGPLPPGDYSILSTGSRDILPFRVDVKLPALPDIPRDVPLLASGEVLIEWDPAVYSEGDLVALEWALASRFDSYVCKTRARNGAMRIPASLFPFPIVHTTLSVVRRKDTPLLFPFSLRNGVQFHGIVDYAISGPHNIRIRTGANQ